MLGYPITLQEYEDIMPTVPKFNKKSHKLQIAKQNLKFFKDFKTGKIKNPHPKMLEAIKNIW